MAPSIRAYNPVSVLTFRPNCPSLFMWKNGISALPSECISCLWTFFLSLTFSPAAHYNIWRWRIKFSLVKVCWSLLSYSIYSFYPLCVVQSCMVVFTVQWTISCSFTDFVLMANIEKIKSLPQYLLLQTLEMKPSKHWKILVIVQSIWQNWWHANKSWVTAFANQYESDLL